VNNWQDIDSCFGTPDETLSSRCGGQGVVIFFGMAKPVRPADRLRQTTLERMFAVAVLATPKNTVRQVKRSV